MSTATNILAGIGGAAKGIDNAARFWATDDRQRDATDAKLTAQEEALQIRTLLANLREEGLDTRSAAANGSRQTIAAGNNATATNIAGMNNTSREGIATDNRNADLDKFWNGTMNINWDRNFLTRRGQDVNASTARRGQDVSAGNARLSSDTSQRNADQSAAVTQRGQDMTQGRAGATLEQRASQNWFAPEDQAPIEPAITPPTIAAPPRVGTPAASIAPPRSAPAAPPAAPAQTSAPKVTEGQTVTLKGGQKVVIRKLYPDGTFDFDPVR